jgi:uncharacterized membrane protein YdbT with pleckstrin-like domain
MSYVQHVLQPGEEIRHIAKIHWVKFIPGFAVILLGLLIFILAEQTTSWHRFLLVIAAAVALLGLAHFLYAWFDRWTTEIAVTNRRIIFKEGFIRRNTVEMHMDKVESVDVAQSILGRLLDYGNVEVRGTGTGFEPLRFVDRPLELRNHITGI